MDIFSNLMIIGECLLDTKRIQSFARAIATTVKSSDVVVDVGTGSGVLAMMEAHAGAKRVYAVDIAPDIVKFAKTNITQNKLDKTIKVYTADAKNFTLSRSADVVIMELMDTWLVAEQQAVVLNQLRKTGVINQQTRLIPYRYQCALTLAQYDFSFYGFHMPFIIQARNFGVTKRINAILSKTVIVNDIDFRVPVATRIDKTITIPVTKSGKCNALILKAKIFLSPRISAWGTTDMNMPVVVPIPERPVRQGKQLTLRIQYCMGEGFQTFKANFRG